MAKDANAVASSTAETASIPPKKRNVGLPEIRNPTFLELRPEPARAIRAN
jgi:hypothetical protein